MENLNAVPTPRNIEELQKEISRLDSIDTNTTKRVDKEVRLEGLNTFDSELKPIDERWSDIYGHSAKAYDDSARMVRLAMTNIIRLEKYKQNSNK